VSKLIGNALPEQVSTALDGRDLAQKVGPAHLLLTMDADGMPRPCMLSAGELLAVDERTLRVALWPGTRTAANLERDGRALLCYVDAEAVLYVRGTVRPLDVTGPLPSFELAVESVESDAHAGMPVTSGIRFAVERGDVASVAQAWDEQLGPLREH
jgi:hypothetical protein